MIKKPQARKQTKVMTKSKQDDPGAAQEAGSSTFFQAVGDKKPVLTAFIVLAMFALLNWIIFTINFDFGYSNGREDLVGMVTNFFPIGGNGGNEALKEFIRRSVLILIGATGLVLGVIAASA